MAKRPRLRTKDRKYSNEQIKQIKEGLVEMEGFVVKIAELSGKSNAYVSFVLNHEHRAYSEHVLDIAVIVRDGFFNAKAKQLQNAKAFADSLNNM